jgi:hypothetical protein
MLLLRVKPPLHCHEGKGSLGSEILWLNSAVSEHDSVPIQCLSSVGVPDRHTHGSQRDLKILKFSSPLSVRAPMEGRRRSQVSMDFLF